MKKHQQNQYKTATAIMDKAIDEIFALDIKTAGIMTISDDSCHLTKNFANGSILTIGPDFARSIEEAINDEESGDMYISAILSALSNCGMSMALGLVIIDMIKAHKNTSKKKAVKPKKAKRAKLRVVK